MTLLDSLTLGLAGYRLAVILVMEDGPFDVALRLRHLLGAEKPGPQGVAAKLINCMWCSTFWCSLLAYGITFLSPTAVYLLAAAAVALIVSIWMGLHES